MYSAESASSWPPPYAVKISNKAKKISLKVCRARGLQIILPKRQAKTNPEQILQEHKTWVLRHLDTILATQSDIILPNSLNLAALNEVWELKYLLTPSNANNVLTPNKADKAQLKVINALKVIVVNYTEPKNIQKISALLRKWLVTHAKIHLEARSRQLSVQHKLDFNALSIKGQRTLWGSCDFKQNINLNFKLMFLPYELLEYVVLHELAHTKVLNHSKKFWALVALICPNYKASRRLLRAADKYVPRFLV